VRDALDQAELAFTGYMFSRFGSFDAKGKRVLPLCNADLEKARIAAKSLPTSACCSALPLTTLCFDGNMGGLMYSGYEWADRAWLALDAAHRSAQNGDNEIATGRACCASLYYAQLAQYCGVRGDLWQLAQSSVVRQSDGVGATLLAFEDGHQDGDLNDFIIEQRVVEIRAQDRSLRALNVHTLPLARGGGFTSSYALLFGGVDAAIAAIVDNGNNTSAACPERDRQLLAAALNVQAVRATAGAVEPIPAGSFVGIVRHVTSTIDSLPNGVLDHECVTIGGAGPAYCSRASSATLYANTKQTLPPTNGDALESLGGAAGAVRYRETTVNTQSGTRRVRALFAASATIVFSGNDAAASSVVGVLRNQDCGVASLATDVPTLALSLPASVADSWRWAAEGVRLIVDPSSSARQCRGGADSGIAQCTNDAICAFGGICSAPPSIVGVPYPLAYAYFQCQSVECLEENRAWYLDANARNGTLLYVPAIELN
jgi:hypothetical protein